MANLNKRLPENVPGSFYVDSTCIDCDTCRQIAPETFDDSGDYSFVKTQPQTADAIRQATRALLACPTGSIGTVDGNDAKAVMQDFPLLLEEDVYYCGFNSPKSYGGNSYFIRHPEGNWLVDSPKYLPHLVKQFEALGGLAYIFLTHRDDVADADKYAQHFGAKRIIHHAELSAQPDAEIVVESTDEAVPFGLDFQVIPTPGHTQGHCVLLYRNKFLFTGDHLWWNPHEERLGASKTFNWYSWPQQKNSLAKLQDYTFEWVLPGHGQRINLPAVEMREKLSSFVGQIT